MARGRLLNAVNVSPVLELVGTNFYFNLDEMHALVAELNSLDKEGQFLPSVLEGMRRNINMQISQRATGEGWTDGS